MTEGRSAPVATFGANAWLLIGGQSIAIMGDSLLLIVVPLLVLDRTGSALQVSLVFILTQLPAFLGFLSGTARRHAASKTLIVTYDYVRLGLLLGIALLLALRSDALAGVYVLFFAVNCFTALFRPTRIELISQIVPKHALLKFNSYDRTLEALATAFGLGLGGYAYRYLPIPSTFLLAALTFLVSGTSILFLQTTIRGEAPVDQVPVASTFLATLVRVARNRVAGFLVGGEGIAGVAFGAFTSTFVIYARRYLSVDSVTLGHFEMLQGLFAMVAGLCIAAGLLRLSNRSLAVIGYLGMAASTIVLGINAAVWPVYLLMVTFGFFNMLYAVAIRTLLQLHCPKEELIHVFALESMLGRASFIAGSALAGAALTLAVAAVNQIVLYAGLVFLLVTIWGFLALFGLGSRVAGRAMS
jgi:Major Facilitator Superfamily